MLIGVVVGCYSSIFIAAPVMYDLDKDHDKYKGDANDKAKPKKK